MQQTAILPRNAPNAACARDVSYLEETCYHVVISGLHDSDMKDRALTQAMLGNVSDMATLVNYCTAEESGKCVVQTVGAIKKSTYQGGAERTPPPSKCAFCGEKQHGGGKREDREKSCKAWGKQCSKCNRLNHYACVFKSASRPLNNSPKPKTETESTNAAFGFFSNSLQPLWRPWEQPDPSSSASWSFPAPAHLSDCRPSSAPVSTSNRFALLSEPDPVSGFTAHRVHHQPAQPQPQHPDPVRHAKPLAERPLIDRNMRQLSC